MWSGYETNQGPHGECILEAIGAGEKRLACETSAVYASVHVSEPQLQVQLKVTATRKGECL